MAGRVLSILSPIAALFSGSDQKLIDNETGRKLTLERLMATRFAAQSLIESLNSYYNGEAQARRMLMEPWIDAWDFDASPAAEAASGVTDENGMDNDPARRRRTIIARIRRQRASKMVDTMARALVTDEQDRFVVGTIGSSVAAGHDNCYFDSYENQLMRTWGPVWEAAGMEFVHQNAGEGGGCGDDFKNQVFCIKQNVSPDVDIVHYTWTYFESGEEAPPHRENLIRWTQMLPKQPPVHVFNTGRPPHPTENLDEYKLVKYYADYGYDAFYMRQGFENGGHDYETEKKNDIDRFSWGYVGDGYHNVTRYGEKEVDPARKQSLGVVMRNWHPGPLAFQFTADAFAYVYSTAMLKALDMIETDMRAGNDPREKWSASERNFHIKSSLPPPILCDPTYCVVDEAPGCLNFELPTYGQWGARVEDPDDSLNPHRGELQNWEMWRANNDMWHAVGKQDMAVFQRREDKEMCRHMDACGGIRATSPENGMVVFRLPKMEVGLVVICGCCGKDVAEPMFINNPYIEIRYNGEVLDRSTWDVFPTKKCVRLLSKFPTMGAMAQTPTGHAYLSVRVLGDMGGDEVKISQVITL